ncbi:hypothetical protein SADUNF_Sadunf16G0149000 [Salix dunnii]|uniref:Uncharacterized protein n=1 Tax=Salix dunnii TaxID=1413687 RepID=A0A835JC80_9ROSI|nr:hypothetical protein SADUNF_Sadunf16G0149000 [Salix dunnii]
MSLQYLAISECEALSSFPECLSSFMHLTEINLRHRLTEEDINGANRSNLNGYRVSLEKPPLS